MGGIRKDPPTFNGRNVASGQIASGNSDSSGDGNHEINTPQFDTPDPDAPAFDAPELDTTLAHTGGPTATHVYAYAYTYPAGLIFEDHDYLPNNRSDSLVTEQTDASRPAVTGYGGRLHPGDNTAPRAALTPSPTPSIVPRRPALTMGNMAANNRHHSQVYRPGDIESWTVTAAKCYTRWQLVAQASERQRGGSLTGYPSTEGKFRLRVDRDVPTRRMSGEFDVTLGAGAMFEAEEVGEYDQDLELDEDEA